MKGATITKVDNFAEQMDSELNTYEKAMLPPRSKRKEQLFATPKEDKKKNVNSNVFDTPHS